MSDPLVTIILPGDPRGKGRPRFRIVKPRGRPQFVTVYTDSDTVSYERDLAAMGRQTMAGRKPMETALTLFVEAFMPIPPSWPKKKQAAAIAGEIFPSGKPDYDNISKIVGDALNKIVWADDSQIVMGQCLKLYSDYPRLRVSVWEFDDVGPSEPELI